MPDLGREPEATDTPGAPDARAAREVLGPTAANRTCPFLRGIDAEGTGRAPILAPDPSNRCLASGDPDVVSSRDQGAVCLTAGHVECPRLVRAAPAAVSVTAAPRGSRVSIPILASIAILVAAAAIALASVVARGSLATDGPSGSASAVASSAAALASGPAPTPPVAPTSALSARPGGASVTPAAGPSAAVPSAPVTPAPTPHSTQTPAPTPKSYPGVVPCPDAPDC